MTFVIFLGVLSVLVLIHEFGHFAAAKIFGIKVEEFALGLPFTKPIFKFVFGETQYAVYPLLFGGFVKLYGEDTKVQEHKGSKDFGRDFWTRGKKQRMLVLVAGILMNVVLSLCLFVALYLVIGVPSETKNLVTVNLVEAGSPAQVAGLKTGDRITNVATTTEFSKLTKDYAGKKMVLNVRRGETIALFEGIVEKDTQTLEIPVTPRVNPPAGQGALGVSISEYPYVMTSRRGNVLVASFKATVAWGGRILDGFRSIGKSLLAGQKPEGVAGPIGIYQLTGVVAGEGILPLMELVAILSLNLAVFNILPIPALDGGRIFFVWLEWVRRKRVSPQLESKINAWGMAVLLGLMALISLQDVIRLYWK
jgi:regulator of sigma E protease